MRVVVSVTNNLVADQRVERICQSLHKWGYHVQLIGRNWPKTALPPKPYSCKRLNLFFNRKVFFYAEYNIRLFFYLFFRKADILIANDLDTLPANYLISGIKGTRLFFDSHEYFPETPEVYQRRFVRNFWLFIEKLFVKGCSGYYTVSASLADIYRQKYGIEFHVIRNVPFRYNVSQDLVFNRKIILYQGTINRGRGIELILQTMPLLPAAHLIIAGDGPELEKIKSLANDLQLHNQVQFTGFLLPEKLKALTLTASVGISLEEATGLSYISALPNKLFDYIQAGIPVLVSGLPEMKAVVEKYKVGMILEERSPGKLASLLNIMMNDEVKRKDWKENLAKAADELCWEKEELKLKGLFE